MEKAQERKGGKEGETVKEEEGIKEAEERGITIVIIAR